MSRICLVVFRTLLNGIALFYLSSNDMKRQKKRLTSLSFYLSLSLFYLSLSLFYLSLSLSLSLLSLPLSLSYSLDKLEEFSLTARFGCESVMSGKLSVFRSKLHLFFCFIAFFYGELLMHSYAE